MPFGTFLGNADPQIGRSFEKLHEEVLQKAWFKTPLTQAAKKEYIYAGNHNDVLVRSAISTAGTITPLTHTTAIVTDVPATASLQIAATEFIGTGAQFNSLVELFSAERGRRDEIVRQMVNNISNYVETKVAEIESVVPGGQIIPTTTVVGDNIIPVPSDFMKWREQIESLIGDGGDDTLTCCLHNKVATQLKLQKAYNDTLLTETEKMMMLRNKSVLKSIDGFNLLQSRKIVTAADTPGVGQTTASNLVFAPGGLTVVSLELGIDPLLISSGVIIMYSKKKDPYTNLWTEMWATGKGNAPSMEVFIRTCFGVGTFEPDKLWKISSVYDTDDPYTGIV